MKTCSSGKKLLDKKGATSLKNFLMEMHHMKMTIYECPECHYWHTSTKERHHRQISRKIVLGEKYRFRKYSKTLKP